MLAVISNVKRAGISPMPVPSPPSQFRVIRKLDLANKLFWSREPLPKRSYQRGLVLPLPSPKWIRLQEGLTCLG